MTHPRSRSSRLRTAGTVVLATAALAVALPGVANATPAKPGDRTVLATVQNDTGLRLKLVETELAEGKWTTDPPNAVRSYSRAGFGSTSSKNTGGTEATVVYKTKYGNVELYWDHPWATDGDVTCEVPDELTCETETSGSSKMKVTYILAEA